MKGPTWTAPQSERDYYRDYEKRFHDSLVVAEEGMLGIADLLPAPVFSRRIKRPARGGIRDFSIRKTLQFLFDRLIEVDCQLAASDVRKKDTKMLRSPTNRRREGAPAHRKK